ncbi:hypothetical protein [Alkaliphilus sp. B6464]|uniref:hypothetical protein n=1 Tax=Alkaliphilus sp. B6464 TaxID=2731219 RepID=UPI001BAC0113|nr:hypothetical protein [Alkaliphilus sp. B6464]QUH22133.1 hypothetical protein HYG84_19695 [Alkaliphilus sp. B6464]
MFRLNRKGQTYPTVIIGIIIIILLSGVTHGAIRESLDKLAYRTKDFHSFVLAHSELNKELSKNVLSNRFSERTIKIDNNQYTVRVSILDTSRGTKNIDVEVLFNHKGNEFAKKLSTERNV